MNPYRPWLCLAGHRLEIEEVTDDGVCVRCGNPALVKTNPEQVRAVLEQERLKRKYIVDWKIVGGKRIRPVDRECAGCHLLFKTYKAQQLYHSETCKNNHARARHVRRKMGMFTCMFCGETRESTDLRRKFCGKECRLEFRGRKKG